MQQVNPPLFEYQDHAYQRTEWMGGNLKPAHVGVYERDYGSDGGGSTDIVYSYWDGLCWYVYGETPAEAKDGYNTRDDTLYQSEPWRGLTKPVMEKLA